MVKKFGYTLYIQLKVMEADGAGSFRAPQTVLEEIRAVELSAIGRV